MIKNSPRPETFTPAKDRLLILPMETSNKTAGGIMMPEDKIERPQIGTVILTGPEANLYKVGQFVLYGKTAGIKIDFEISEVDASVPEYKEHWLMRESEIFGGWE